MKEIFWGKRRRRWNVVISQYSVFDEERHNKTKYPH